MASLPISQMSFEQYLEMESHLDTKYEYYHGQVFAKGGASPAHVFIHANLVRKLGNQLDGTGCRALGPDLRVHVLTSGLYTYPDISIFCGPLALEGNHAATNPKTIIDILSPSSRRYDRVGKFEHYRQIPTLDEYILVEQQSYSVDSWRRMPGGEWQLSSCQGEDAMLEIPSVGIQIPLAEIYADVPFAAGLE